MKYAHSSHYYYDESDHHSYPVYSKYSIALTITRWFPLPPIKQNTIQLNFELPIIITLRIIILLMIIINLLLQKLHKLLSAPIIRSQPLLFISNTKTNQLNYDTTIIISTLIIMIIIIITLLMMIIILILSTITQHKKIITMLHHNYLLINTCASANLISYASFQLDFSLHTGYPTRKHQWQDQSKCPF